jgi:prophage tail gpP-like protein
MLYADHDLLIVSVVFMLDEQGSRTELQLVRREAFDLVEGVGLDGRQDRRKKTKSDDWSLLF